MSTIIRAENLSKQYFIEASRPRAGSLRDSLGGLLKRRMKRIGGAARRRGQEFWALSDVSFSVKQGEVVGIVGRNGAGKSTLLKVLSRITEPTEGRAELYGRVGSLLEVGTGFHHELTGRENIYLNGAMLGMKRGEIERKFDEIVAFAEMDKFLDTPVKRYSSGMYTRLAFAVAAHLEPEILLVDEVLAVGDASFQKKCLGKMGEVAQGGRTVLYVSHNLGSMANLCPRAILLESGRKTDDGPTPGVIGHYISGGRETGGERVWTDPQNAPGGDKVRLRSVKIVSGGQVTSDVDISEEVRVEIEFWNYRPGLRLAASIHLLDKTMTGILSSINAHSATPAPDEWFNEPHPAGLYRTACVLPANFLNEGAYHINALVLSDVSRVEAFAEEAVTFTVHESGEMRREFGGEWLGVVRPKLAWRTEQLSDGEGVGSAGGASARPVEAPRRAVGGEAS